MASNLVRDGYAGLGLGRGLQRGPDSLSDCVIGLSHRTLSEFIGLSIGFSIGLVSDSIGLRIGLHRTSYRTPSDFVSDSIGLRIGLYKATSK